jgi:hypothetical protein
MWAGGRLSFDAGERHRLSAVTLFSDVRRDNVAPEPFARVSDSQIAQTGQGVFTSIAWRLLAGDRVVVTNRVGLSRLGAEDLPALCRTRPGDCDRVPAMRQTYPRDVTLANSDRHDRIAEDGAEISSRIEWPGAAQLFGAHSLAAGLRARARSWRFEHRTPGDEVIVLNGAIPSARTEVFAEDPRLGPGARGWWRRRVSGLTALAFIEDRARLPGGFTLTPGLAFVAADVSRGDEQILAGSAVTPGLGVAWDATGDGLTVVHASVQRRAELDVKRVASFAAGEPTRRTCRWDDAAQTFTRDCTFSHGDARTFGLPCSPIAVDAAGEPCRERVELPLLWEVTAGAERQITRFVTVGADLVYQRASPLLEQRETNRVWNVSGTSLAPAGGFRTGRATTVNDMSSPADGFRRYLGVTPSVRARSESVDLGVAYTWSRFDGTVTAPPAGRPAALPGVFDVPEDHRHVLQAHGRLSLFRLGSLGLVYRYVSGAPYRPYPSRNVAGSFDDYRMRVGASPGARVNDPDNDRPTHGPDWQALDLQARVAWKRLTGVDLDTYLDVLDLFAARPAASDDGPAFLPAGPPARRFRLGIELRY